MNPNIDLSKPPTYSETESQPTQKVASEGHIAILQKIHKAATQSGAKHSTDHNEMISHISPTTSAWEEELQDAAMWGDTELYTKFNSMAWNDDEIPSVHEFNSNYQTEAKIGKNAVAAGQKDALVTERAKQWVQDSINVITKNKTQSDGQHKYTFAWSSIPLDDPFFLAHKDEVLLAAIAEFNGAVTGAQLKELITQLTDKSVLTGDIAQKVFKMDPQLLVFKNELFPEFKIGREQIDDLVTAGKASDLAYLWRSVEPSALQYAIDTSVELSEYEWVEQCVSSLPATIVVPERVLVSIAVNSPYKMKNLLAEGRLVGLRDNYAVMKTLAESGFNNDASKYASDALLLSLTIPEIRIMLDYSVTVEVVIRLVGLGLLKNDEDIELALAMIPLKLQCVNARRFSRDVQSWIFNQNLHDNLDWITDIRRFTNLKQADYLLILDNKDYLFSQVKNANAIRVLFDNAKGLARARYMGEVDQKITAMCAEADAREQRNSLRGNQRQLEDEYLKAGNIDFGAKDANEELTMEEKIRCLDIGHCVRRAPKFADMVKDDTRTNAVNCNVSEREPSSSSIFYKTTPTTLSEHEGLVQLNQFFETGKENSPDNPFFDDMLNNLTFIGAREYAEAIEGIAAYWKWYLDSDSEHQLCLKTVVSRSTIKSDQYMLDRILGQFSDSEIEQYGNRMVLQAGEITQVDPQKVKVVLLDDWTISGSQLKGGYATFVRKNNHLAASVEVQLIAASAQRIARGIEGLEYYGEESGIAERHVPIVTRAYYLAHEATTTGYRSPGARVSGSHSSVDYGFKIDIMFHHDQIGIVPGLSDVLRPYRDSDFTLENIERFNMIHATRKSQAVYHE